MRFITRILAASISLAVAAGAAAASVAVASPSSASAATALPALTGPHEVGSAEVHLVDQRRVDPWKPGRKRESMITVFYPASNAGHYRLRPYLSKALLPAFPIDFSFALSVHSHSHVDAPVDSHLGKRPVILFSPGYGMPPTMYSLEAEDLASHGYIFVTED